MFESTKTLIKIVKSREIPNIYRILKLSLPFLFIFNFIYFTASTLPSGAKSKYLSLTIAYVFPPIGKESIIPALLLLHLHPALVFLTIFFIDLCSVLILCYSWWFAEILISKNRWINRGYKKLQQKATQTKSKRWVLPSLLIFMIIPFQGTGAISTTLIARILGYPPKIIIPLICIGSIITTSIILFGVNFII